MRVNGKVRLWLALLALAPLLLLPGCGEEVEYVRVDGTAGGELAIDRDAASQEFTPPQEIRAMDVNASAGQPGAVQPGAVQPGARQPGAQPGQPGAQQPGQQGPQAGAGRNRENAVGACGPRESYDYVARVFQCPGGGNPFNGNANAARGARVGNVGANSSGHIVDLYRVPCPRGPVEVYVDMYQCPPGRSPYRKSEASR